jgi:hypothetical protein
VHPAAASNVRIGIRRQLWKRPAGWIWKAIAVRSRASVEGIERLAGIGERLHLYPLLALLYPLIWDGNYWRGVEAAKDKTSGQLVTAAA